MEKQCNIKVGMSPCTYCGAKSSAININGDPVCDSCCTEKKACANSCDTMDKMIGNHNG